MEKSKWAEHDATELLRRWKGPFEALIDVGTGDNFYKNGQLLLENFEAAAQEGGVEKGVNVRYQKVSSYSDSLPRGILLILRIVGLRSQLLFCLNLRGGSRELPCEVSSQVVRPIFECKSSKEKATRALNLLISPSQESIT